MTEHQQRRSAAVSLTACLMFLLFTTPLTAQEGGISTGPDGVYIALGTSILPATVEGVPYTAYRVERREAGASSWEEIARVSAPVTQIAFDRAFRQQMQRFPELADLSINTAALWGRVTASRQLRDIGMAGRLLPVQLALGVRWLDTTVERAAAYEYRIGRMTDTGPAPDAVTTPGIVFPGLVDLAQLRTVHTHGETMSAQVTWRAGEGHPPAAFRVFRRMGIDGPFSPLPLGGEDSCCTVSMSLVSRNDTVFCSLYDKTVEHGQLYQYYAEPMDYFRNIGRPSDTATVITFQMRQVPLPDHLAAYSVDTAGIRIRWNLRELSAVHGIVIERGPKIDSGFVELFTAAPTDTSFLDVTVEPMQRYYYRFRLIGPGGLRSVASAVIFGMFKSSVVPTPPNGVQARAIEDGIRISWAPDRNQHLKGYYVYRSDGFQAPMKLLSPLLPVEQGVFVDTSSALQPAQAYMYALQSVTSSHVSSVLSDTVSAIPVTPVNIAAPLDIEAVADGSTVHVSWNTVNARDPSILGYLVYRKGEKDKRMTAVADTLQASWQNYYTDHDLPPGSATSYAVRVVSITQDTSDMSAAAAVRIAGVEYYPPGNLRAWKERRSVHLTWDEVVQPGIKGLRLYRYVRGKKPQLIRKLKPNLQEYVDKKPGRVKLVSYYLTVIGEGGVESARSKVVTVPLR
ncbi:MAG: hypothetical protein C0600_13355 [Ignavibacteria bacterium]|nr:MAG: hypothetical protein C0600_13355 [Ignavibacteria bacterium]